MSQPVGREWRSRQAANSPIGDPERFVDAAVQFRQFYCRAPDPLLGDIQLAVDA